MGTLHFILIKTLKFKIVKLSLILHIQIRVLDNKNNPIFNKKGNPHLLKREIHFLSIQNKRRRFYKMNWIAYTQIMRIRSIWNLMNRIILKDLYKLRWNLKKWMGLFNLRVRINLKNKTNNIHQCLKTITQVRKMRKNSN